MRMKKVLFLLVALSLVIGTHCLAIDRSDKLLSLVNLSRETTTKQKVTDMLGQPVKIEENKKRIWWHYINGNTNLVICWNKKSDAFENCSFSSTQSEKCVFDSRLSRKLRSGSTDMLQALTLLGTPVDMKIKGATQEMHYSYQNSVLRLFFRDRVLVDFTLLGQVK